MENLSPDDALPFDEKNARDFIEITNKIEAALAIIGTDNTQAATKANLAKLSGVHRNTLRHRAIMAGANELVGGQGWPYSALEEIKRSRSSTSAAAHPMFEETLEDRVGDLERRLSLSRYQVSSWHSRVVELKRERDEARRNVGLLLDQTKSLKVEVERLRKLATQNIKVMK